MAAAYDIDSLHTMFGKPTPVVACPFYDKPRQKLSEITLRPQSVNIYSAPDSTSVLPASHEDAHEIGIQTLMRKVSAFATLASNWDGYDGVPASWPMVRDAFTFLKKLPYHTSLPTPMLSGNGQIAFYWERDGLYLEATMEGNGTYHYFADFEDNYEGEDDLALADNSFTEQMLEKLSTFIA